MTDIDKFFEQVGSNKLNEPPRKKPAPPVSSNNESDTETQLVNTPYELEFATENRMWSVSGDYAWPAAKTVRKLSPGYYKFTHVHNIGYCLEKGKVSTDNLLALPDSAGSVIAQEFRDFWKSKERFLSRGLIHKRGILLHGPAGSGKTAILMLMMAEIIESGGLVVQIDNPNVAAVCLSFIRKVEPDRAILALLEDIDSLIEQYTENAFLSLLDGETQVDNIVYIATTNYPERLDKRFVDRPSRFDTIMYVGMPSAKARREFLIHKEPSLQGVELDEWVKASEGLSIAHLRELIISVKVFERPFDSAIKRLEAMRVLPNSSHSPDRIPIGVTGAKT